MDPGTAERRISNPQSFWLEARSQGVCAKCGKADSFDAHHVVERQLLKSKGLPEWDVRNALRLCDRFSKRKCHGGQSSKLKKVELTSLTDENIAYAFEVLGSAAEHYLHRHYDGEDPRVDTAAAEAVSFP